jgi:hypothetical protein
LLLTAVVAGAVLFTPISNALGLDLSKSIADATYVVHWTILAPILVWILAMYFAWKEPTEHWLAVIFNAAGLPGMLLAIASAVSR